MSTSQAQINLRPLKSIILLMLTDVSTNISSFQKGVASAENETERPQSFYVVKKKEIGMFPKVFEA